MIMLGKDVINKTVVHVDEDEEKPEVKDILVRKNQPEIGYLTYELKVPSEELGPGEDPKNVERGMTAAGSTNPGQFNVVSGAGPGEPGISIKTEKQIFLIPKKQIDRITANAVVMSGTEVQEESWEEDFYSYSLLKDREIESEDGEKLGKIKDIVIEEMEKKIIGLKLSEGFWEKLIGDGTKYMPYEGFVEWNDDKIIVTSTMKDRLVDEYEQLV